MKYFITYLLLIFLIFSCEKNSPAPEIENTIISIESNSSSYNVGETIQVKVTIENIVLPVFDFYCNILYDSAKLDIDNSADLIVGDFLSDNIIPYINVQETIITSIQREIGVTGDGTAFFLSFEAVSSGQAILEFEPDELDFYDSSGSIMNIENIELQSLTISIY